MTSALLDSPAHFPDRPALDGGATLEELLRSALTAAHANGSAQCPVCHAGVVSTRARGGAAGRAAEAGCAAECGGCGSRLS